MNYVSNQEIIGFLKGRKLPNKIEIQKRLNHLYVYYYEKGAHFIYDEKMIRKIQEMVADSVNESQEIKGIIAQKGKVSGRVVLVHNKKDLEKINEDGIVLVARFTMPDYTPAMQIASAFVTEEGGVTSHAAIIARELKKPCIVGTGNCTKVLKDGDMVEVDAERGIVRIIK